MVAFTLIDGVFKTYDFPGAQNTYFYALGNDGRAAGFYEDSEGLHHGVILEDGEMRQYDFNNAVQTEIYGISDATGVLTGNWIDTAGVRRGFTGHTILEFPGATATFADFVNSEGNMFGSYIDADGIFQEFAYSSDGRYISFDLANAENLEFFYVHGYNDAKTRVARGKAFGDVIRTYLGTFVDGLRELKVPDSVSTEGYNINQDGSVVGFYETPDGRRHGFVANPIEVVDKPVFQISGFTYTFESIDVPGVDYLSLTASSDYQDYAGYTKSPDGEKMVAFTLINGVFKTYDFPGALNTYFYALGNNGDAAGYYEDSDGHHRGIVLKNGELGQYDFPNSVETEIYGISDATGNLTGNWKDASGVRRGFTGNIIVEYPGAAETFADFINSQGGMVGSYVDDEGTYTPYLRAADGRFVSFNLPTDETYEFFFVHGQTDTKVSVSRGKVVGDVTRTYVGSFLGGLHELKVPGSVSTEGYNINQDASVVGFYETTDGRRRGFFARLADDTTPPIDTEPVAKVNIKSVPAPDGSNYTFESIEVEGVDYLALTASSDFDDYAGYMQLTEGGKEIAWTIIDNVFTTYDFPGSLNTYFYALGNNGTAAGYYEDSEGLHHGVILENGEMRRYDFPDAVETEIWGISDATGAMTGNFIDVSGVRRGFSGNQIIEPPGATATFADFVNAEGVIVGSYIDADGVFQAYVRTPDERFALLPLPKTLNTEYLFMHGINDAGVFVIRLDWGRGPRTMAGPFDAMKQLEFPGAVSTEGYNINQDGSVAGYYNTADGQRYGFIAKPVSDDRPVVAPAVTTYSYESIDVVGVDYLALTASSDFGDYAGYTRSPNTEKIVAFTLIDGVFTTYNFPGAQETRFYALGNNGQAAGHYKDSDGNYHGVILENGEMRQFDYANAVQTFLYGYSDATGALTGDFIDAAGVQRGFSGDLIIDIPGATATHTDFVNAEGSIVGSYVDAEGTYHAYVRLRSGNFATIDLPTKGLTLEYFFVHGISDARSIVARAKAVGDVPRTYAGQYVLHELQFPGSVSTEGYNINQDGSVVGHYESTDGRVHGFIARPVSEAESTHFGNVFNVTLSKGLNMISVPLAQPNPMTAKSLAGITGATVVITLDADRQRYVGWTPSAPDDGFPIKGGQGYIVNVPKNRNFAFVGSPWENQTEAAAPAISIGTPKEAWAFVVSGHLKGNVAFDGYEVIARNLRTNSTITASVEGNYFAAATADLTRRSVVEVGDVIEVRVLGPDGNIESQTRSFKVTPEHLANAVLPVNLDGIGQPQQNQLLQNYPNPFNPETWIPYQLSENSAVSVSIYDKTGKLIRSLSLGTQSAGFYNSRERAAYWDGKNALGESVASGIYFYQLTTPTFKQTRRLVIVK